MSSSTAQLLGLDDARAGASARRGLAALRAALDALPGDRRPALEVLERAEYGLPEAVIDGEQPGSRFDLLIERACRSALAEFDARGARLRGEDPDPAELARWQADVIELLVAIRKSGYWVRRPDQKALQQALYDSLWLGEHAGCCVPARLRALLDLAAVGGIPVAIVATSSSGSTRHAVADEYRTACGRPLPTGKRTDPDAFGRIDCGNCARRLGAALREPLDLDHLVYFCSEAVDRRPLDILDVLAGSSEEPTPDRLRAGLQRDHAREAAERLAAILIGNADPSLSLALLDSKPDPLWAGGVRKLIALALQEPDAERALAELRRDCGLLAAGKQPERLRAGGAVGV